MHCIFKAQYGIILALLVAICHIKSTSSLMCECERELEREQWRKQQVSVQMNWLLVDSMISGAANGMSEAGNLQDVVASGSLQEQVNRRLASRVNQTVGFGAAETILNGRVIRENSGPDNQPTLISVNLTIKSREKPNKDYLLSGDILDSLGYLVDCNRECRTIGSVVEQSNRAHFELYPVGDLLDANHASRLLIAGLISVRLDFAKPGTILRSVVSDEESSYSREAHQVTCTLCDQIQARKSSLRHNLRRTYAFIVDITTDIVSILEPHNWLIVIVAIWLATCFMIAMYIKRRDRRRLRLYLAEEAEYSFTAKRHPND